MYYAIHSTNLVYHFREAEYRRNTKNLDFNKKLENFASIIYIVGNGIKNPYLSEADLISFDYNTDFK